MKPDKICADAQASASVAVFRLASTRENAGAILWRCSMSHVLPSARPIRIIFSLALLLTLLSCKKETSLNAEDNVVETLPALYSSVSAEVNTNCGGYYQALPARYDSSSKKYPLILFVHGIGELGNGSSDLSKMTRAGLPRLINKKGFPPSFQSGGKHYSFIVIAPQFREWPSNKDVDEVLQYAVNRFRVDASRIYVTGLSMGGGVTWEYAAEYGDAIAAIAPICGGSWPEPKRAEKIAGFDLPVWAFHNNDDQTVPVSFTVDYVSRINSYHPAIPARATTWPTGGHDSWTKAYDPTYRENGMNIYEWMLQHQRRVPK